MFAEWVTHLSIWAKFSYINSNVGKFKHVGGNLANVGNVLVRMPKPVELNTLITV
jgi:hypothetical protein